ncbi:MAG: hypothetical protein EKK55_21905 [Rhodocyclaceae bacterium]|nr:MAG: hypothetical protein EKK55_21905 [Rhodocyclaceae bacterium]
MAPKRTPAPKPATTTSKGTKRVYIDLPVDLARRFNILAATRSVGKRALLAQIVEKELKEAGV